MFFTSLDGVYFKNTKKGGLLDDYWKHWKRVGYAFIKKGSLQIVKFGKVIKLNIQYIQIIIMKQGFTERLKVSCVLAT